MRKIGPMSKISANTWKCNFPGEDARKGSSPDFTLPQSTEIQSPPL